jgi:hypothetical protein
MNRWKIPDWLERAVKDRDTSCVYCRREFGSSHDSRQRVATWEHIINDARIISPDNIARCCAGCNASKGTKTLAEWLTSDYCQKRGISTDTVADVVRRALGVQSDVSEE